MRYWLTQGLASRLDGGRAADVRCWGGCTLLGPPHTVVYGCGEGMRGVGWGGADAHCGGMMAEKQLYLSVMCLRVNRFQ